MLASRMSSGLNKLIDAAAQVDVLRKELEKNQEEIAAKNVQVEAVSIEIYLCKISISLEIFLLETDFSLETAHFII